jgi:hypothetical protein
LTIEALIQKFVEEKEHKPTSANDLLDFLKRGYIQGKLSFVEYRKLIQELDRRGATMA